MTAIMTADAGTQPPEQARPGPGGRVVVGNPGPVLTQIASGSDDVLVVGTRPGPCLQRVAHGSVSAYCTAHARCPVAVVTPRQVPESGSGQQAGPWLSAARR